MRQFARFGRMLGMLALAGGTLSFAEPRATLAAPTNDPKTALLAALSKSSSASAYQIDMNIDFNMDASQGPNVQNTAPVSMNMAFHPAQVVPLSNMTLAAEQSGTYMHIAAKIKGADFSMALKGLFLSYMGLDADKDLQIIQLGTKASYIHGPAAALGAPKDQWYVASAQNNGAYMADTYTSMFRQIFNENLLKDVDSSLIQNLGKEALNGQQCNMYGAADSAAAIQILKSIDASTMSSSGIDHITKAEVKYWVCADGYLHKQVIGFDGTIAQSSQTLGLHNETSVFDYNGNFTIAAPANAAALEPLPNSALSQPSLDAGRTVTVFNGGNIRALPNAKGEVLGQLHAHQTVELIERTTDGQWYEVNAPESTGWVHVSLLRVSADTASQIFVDGLASVANPPAEELHATVLHGGNCRAGPSAKAAVLGLVKVGQVIQVLAKTKDGGWYYVRCSCGALGWVHASLLHVEPRDARLVPVS